MTVVGDGGQALIAARLLEDHIEASRFERTIVVGDVVDLGLAIDRLRMDSGSRTLVTWLNDEACRAEQRLLRRALFDLDCVLTIDDRVAVAVWGLRDLARMANDLWEMGFVTTTTLMDDSSGTAVICARSYC